AHALDVGGEGRLRLEALEHDILDHRAGGALGVVAARTVAVLAARTLLAEAAAAVVTAGALVTALVVAGPIRLVAGPIRLVARALLTTGPLLVPRAIVAVAVTLGAIPREPVRTVAAAVAAGGAVAPTVALAILTGTVVTALVATRAEAAVALARRGGAFDGGTRVRAARFPVGASVVALLAPLTARTLGPAALRDALLARPAGLLAAAGRLGLRREPAVLRRRPADLLTPLAGVLLAALGGARGVRHGCVFPCS